VIAALALLPLTVLAGEGYEPMEFTGAYAVNGVAGLEPSGLVYCHEKLLFVSDNHDHSVFELVINEASGEARASVFELVINEASGEARAKTYIQIDDIPNPPKQDFPIILSVTRFFAELLGLSGGFDWEGVTCGDTGEIYLASEYYFSVLKIEINGGKTIGTWLGHDLYKAGAEHGLFQSHNAYFEGVAYHKGQIYLAAEREPRGVLRLSNQGEASVYVQSGPHFSPRGLAFDFTGLEIKNNKLITLERNDYLICERSVATYEAVTCWSFEFVGNSEEWGYQKDIYGLAEGLAIVDDTVWIIVDNNESPRKSDKHDSRPLIMAFRYPGANY